MARKDQRTVPAVHLVHLLKQRVDGRQVGSEELIARVLRQDEAAAQEALRAIDRAFGKGTAEELTRNWRGHTPCAVHLWVFNPASGQPPSWFEEALTARLGKEFRKGRALIPDDTVTRNKPARLLRVLLTEDTLHAVVRIRQVRSGTFEDETRELPVTQDVPIELAIDAGKSRLLRVHAGLQLARTAVRQFLLDAFGLELPKSTRAPKSKKKPGRALKAALDAAPLKFDDAHIKRLAAKLNMGNVVGLEGKDARGLQGDLQISGKLMGNRRVELDRTDALVTNQDASNNYARSYNLKTPHNDKFIEISEVRFFLKGAHPHVHFRNRTSRIAINYLIDALRVEVLRE